MKNYRNNTFTRKNLEAALSDEALCHVKYTLWGNNAEKEGYPQIAHCYRVAAQNELAHAKMWMDELGMMGSVNENLQNATTLENNAKESYLSFASDAENEGYGELKEKYLCASNAENNHLEQFSKMHQSFMSGEMFVSPDCDTTWQCYNCGYVSTGEAPPENCPLCGRPETWFAIIN